MNQPRGVPRFLPTLTEVVQVPFEVPEAEAPQALPAEAVPPVHEAEPAPVSASLQAAAAPVDRHDPQAFGQQVRQELEALIDARLEQLVASALAVQIGQIAAQLRTEMRPQLHELVADALRRAQRQSTGD